MRIAPVLLLLLVLPGGPGCGDPVDPEPLPLPLPLPDVVTPLAYTVDRYEQTFDLTTREATSRLWLDVQGAREGCVSIPAPEGVTDVRWQGAPPVSTRTVEGKLEVCGRSEVDFLRWMTARFGPLPYGHELRVAGAPTEWLGMEHPANILLRDNLPLLPKDYANMAMHTLMH